MERALLHFVEKQQCPKVTRIGDTFSPLDEASAFSCDSPLPLPPLSPVSSTTYLGAAINRRRWVRDIHQDEGTEVFVLHADDSALCLLWNKHKILGRGENRRVIRSSLRVHHSLIGSGCI